jgi:uncharacterized repeat protein (TIGR01451 family)
MKKIALLISVLAFLQVARSHAQFVTIPDGNFVTWLQNNGYAGCISGSQLDTSCAAVNNAINLSCTYAGIADLTGIQYFSNLSQLTCSHNDIINIPAFPPSLATLDCSNNLLTSLPLLPAGLTSLTCKNNTLTSLPSLSAGLTYIDCGSNELTQLPTLPSSLVTLSCWFNFLTGFPALPNGLVTLSCASNEITDLPALPPGLTNLTCLINQLTVLPQLPLSLVNLNCGSNQLTFLPELPSSLTDLSCGNNQITYLPELPSGLTDLSCAGNQLTYLPTLPSTLTYLSCGVNSLTTLPDLPSGLLTIMAAYNLLTSLPPLPPVLNVLHLNANPTLPCLPPLEVFAGDDSDIDLNVTGITCLANVIQHTGYIFDIDSRPLCDVFGNGCQVAWNIAGTVTKQGNSGCFPDTSSSPLQNIKLQLLQSGIVQQQVFSNGGGDFSFDADLDVYEIRVDTSSLPFIITCPADNEFTSTLTALDSFDYDADFWLKCNVGPDLGVNSICQTAGVFFPVNQATVLIQSGDMINFYGSSCSTDGLSGSITVIINGPVTYAGSVGTATPDQVNGDTLVWYVNDFSQYNYFNNIGLMLITDTFAQLGSAVCLTVTVDADWGTDINPLNNTLTNCFTVVNSYDPNFKEVYPTTPQPSAWYTYTVHFQNTGTAAAQHIIVKDTLDSNLDWSSFQLLAYSHENLTQVKENGIVHFNFPNINLADSNSNEPASHGWIQYKIKTNSNVNPTITTIHNTASIYFDFNSPIQTNDAIVSPSTGVANISHLDFVLFPNPTNDNVGITLPQSFLNAEVVISDLTGRTVMQQRLGESRSVQLSVKDVATGTYCIRLLSGTHVTAVKRLVVIH